MKLNIFKPGGSNSVKPKGFRVSHLPLWVQELHLRSRHKCGKNSQKDMCGFSASTFQDGQVNCENKVLFGELRALKPRIRKEER